MQRIIRRFVGEAQAETQTQVVLLNHDGITLQTKTEACGVRNQFVSLALWREGGGRERERQGGVGENRYTGEGGVLGAII